MRLKYSDLSHITLVCFKVGMKFPLCFHRCPFVFAGEKKKLLEHNINFD